MLNMIANWRRERSAASQLSRLSDRQLADLGIQRQDIKSVARFAAETNRDEAGAVVQRAFVLTALEGRTNAASVESIYRPTSLAA